MADLNLNLDLYKKLYLIRKAETEIRKHYHENEMKTPMHMSMGGEAISTGVCHALSSNGQVFASYRSHAAFLAKTEDIDFFFAELYGKDTSFLKGKGGSMHLCHTQYGFMATSAIVATHIPVAIGAAFANKVQKNNRIVAVFFGDGATDEGVFWESINVACLFRLPVIFVCEDNGLAVHTSSDQRRGYDSITSILSKFNCNVFETCSTDVEEIYNLTLSAIDIIRSKCEPCFMNLAYYRYLEHVGINCDFDAGYRNKEVFDKWYERDPVKLQRSKLSGLNVSNREIEQIENEIDEKVAKSILQAKKAPLSNCNQLYESVFAG
jgi:pyruvate dehydrogenase E1 component alpha subunit